MKNLEEGSQQNSEKAKRPRTLVSIPLQVTQSFVDSYLPKALHHAHFSSSFVAARCFFIDLWIFSVYFGLTSRSLLGVRILRRAHKFPSICALPSTEFMNSPQTQWVSPQWCRDTSPRAQVVISKLKQCTIRRGETKPEYYHITTCLGCSQNIVCSTNELATLHSWKLSKWANKLTSTNQCHSWKLNKWAIKLTSNTQALKVSISRTHHI